ncbi:MAG TPA: HAMP domain-containing protein [Chromatiales bacterium]|nr:HAMP domain-containing protein [Thiotrichales bacterium]HIP67253.1 HAMP domain-containing protein [Chromatiales bacterium]
MRRWRWIIRSLPMLVLFVLILVSLNFMSLAASDSDRFDQLYIGLLLFNGAMLLLLTVIIIVRLFVLIRQLYKRDSGARLTWRLVLMFIVVALVPVLMVYGFSVRFLGSGIDSWFDVKIEQSLEDALELSRLSLEYRMQEDLNQVEQAAEELANIPEVLAGLSLNDIRRRAGAVEMALLGNNNRIIATSSEQYELAVPKFPTEDIMLLLGQGQNYIGLEPAGEDGLRIRAVVRIKPDGRISESKVLVALFPVSQRISALADSVQAAYGEYKGLVFLRKPLKRSFKLTLALVLLLSTLFAIWAAFAMARRLLSPIVELAEATRAVAAGDYEQKLPVLQSDEMGFLVKSFNEMTARMDQARMAAELSQRVAESQRSYLQAVLGHLTTGVLTIDAGNNLRTANDAANAILETRMLLQQYIGRPFAEVCKGSPLLEDFCKKIGPELRSRTPEWQREVHLFGATGRKVLLCRGVELPATASKGSGQIIVFDDVTNMIKVQRDAAWGEVARRLAHEIKNPLTPIQLSAERLQHKLGKDLSAKQQEVLQRATHTIIQQVDAMKEMVNEFRDYASTPEPVLEKCDLNALVKEVADLYTDFRPGVQVQLDLDKRLPEVIVDAGRIRQVLHNLIKNGFEALKAETQGELNIATQKFSSAQGDYVELRVSDSGHGISEDMIDTLFEPYATNKTKGTGLGLAIVKKIAEEHGGIVIARNQPQGGAQIVIRLPSRRRLNTVQEKTA